MKLIIANKNYSSWSLRPWLLLRKLGLPFEEQLLVFRDDSNTEMFRRFSPSGRVPCLQDGERRIWDSLAIVEYLAEQHPEVWPADRETRAWARCATAEMHSGFATLRNNCSMSVGVRIRLFEISPALQQDLDRLDELWNEGLRRFGGPFLAGPRFTAVDAFFAPVAFRIQTYGLSLSAPAMAYAQRLLDLPDMREWEKAGIAEPYRDAGHEREVQEVGVCTQDFRAT